MLSSAFCFIKVAPHLFPINLVWSLDLYKLNADFLNLDHLIHGSVLDLVILTKILSN